MSDDDAARPPLPPTEEETRALFHRLAAQLGVDPTPCRCRVPWDNVSWQDAEDHPLSPPPSRDTTPREAPREAWSLDDARAALEELGKSPGVKSIPYDPATPWPDPLDDFFEFSDTT